MPKTKEPGTVLYTLEKDKLFSFEEGTEKRKLIRDSCYDIPVSKLIEIVRPHLARQSDVQTFQFEKGTSCGFLFRHPDYSGLMVGTESDQLLDLGSGTINDINRSISRYSSDGDLYAPRLYYRYGYPVHDLTFEHKNGQWVATRIKNATLAEIDFLHHVLEKYGFI